jgi:hypothetical protein
MNIQRVADLDPSSLTRPHVSSLAGRLADELRYFLMPDHFSDGNQRDYRDDDGARTRPTPSLAGYVRITVPAGGFAGGE